MKTAIVSKTFSPKKYKDEELLLKARIVLNQMTNNAYFPGIQAELDELNVKVENYMKAISNSNEGGRLTTVLKRDSRLDLENYLKELTDYVQQISKGAANIILSAGFDIYKKPAKVGELDKPMNVKVKPGTIKGSILLSCDVVDKALFYVFECCVAPMNAESIWTQIASSRRKVQIMNLKSGQEYCFRVAAVRTHPSRIWSDIVKSYVI